MGIISIKKYSGDRKLKEMFLILIKSPQTPLHFLSSEYILREILSHLDSRTGQISKIWKSSGKRNICLTQLLYFSLFCCFPWCSIESLCNLNNLISHLTSESELSTGMISEAFSKLNDSVIYCFLGSPSAVEGTWCGQGLVCLEAAAGSTFVAPALLFPSLWTESLWKPGHRQQISLAEVKFPQQTTGGSARLPQIEPKKVFFSPFHSAVFSWFYSPQALLPLPELDFWVFLFLCCRKWKNRNFHSYWSVSFAALGEAQINVKIKAHRD